MLLLVALHAALFIVAPLLSTHVWTLGPVAIMAGMPLAIVAYGLRDVVQERSGRERAREMVLVAIAVRLLVWPILFAAGFHEEARIAVAGEAQLLVGQWFVATRVFSWARARSGFGLAYNVTAVVSEAVSLAVFVVIANAGTARPILSVIAGGLLLRWVLSLALTPAFWGLARWSLLAGFLLAPAARAADFGPLKVELVTRAMWADNPSQPFRFEGIPYLRFAPFRYSGIWAQDLFIWDALGTKPVKNNKLTMGIEIHFGFSAIYQRQDVTDQRSANRFGIEWRSP